MDSSRRRIAIVYLTLVAVASLAVGVTNFVEMYQEVRALRAFKRACTYWIPFSLDGVLVECRLITVKE